MDLSGYCLTIFRKKNTWYKPEQPFNWDDILIQENISTIHGTYSKHSALRSRMLGIIRNNDNMPSSRCHVFWNNNPKWWNSYVAKKAISFYWKRKITSFTKFQQNDKICFKEHWNTLICKRFLYLTVKLYQNMMLKVKNKGRNSLTNVKVQLPSVLSTRVIILKME